MLELSTKTISLSTDGFNHIVNITPQLEKFLRESDFVEGTMLVFVPGATAGITTIEFENGLVKDLKDFFEKLVPMNGHYYHNDTWHDGNGYAHVRAAMLKPNLLIPFANKRLCLGTWQQVVLIDFDNRPRKRELVLQLTGKLAGEGSD